ncbi:MAG: HPr family phosphocarrier protein [Lachnospiraceae bacterium]|nr:HPr family phosphocarrier protein [Lachnospiraceae bacterium]
MRQFEYVVQSPVGIHARPAMILAQTAMQLTSRITVEYNGKRANAKNMASLLTLRVYQGAKVTFYLEGENEKKDAYLLKMCCEQNL